MTPSGETVYMTISAYLELEKSDSRPAIVTKDLAMVVYGRGDGRIGPRLKNLFQGAFRNPEANRLTGVYEVTLRRALHGSPGLASKLLRNRVALINFVIPCCCRSPAPATPCA